MLFPYILDNDTLEALVNKYNEQAARLNLGFQYFVSEYLDLNNADDTVLLLPQAEGKRFYPTQDVWILTAPDNKADLSSSANLSIGNNENQDNLLAEFEFLQPSAVLYKYSQELPLTALDLSEAGLVAKTTSASGEGPFRVKIIVCGIVQ